MILLLLIHLKLDYFLLLHQGPPSMECDVLYITLDYVMVCPVTTVSHIPHNVRPFFTHCFEYRALFGALYDNSCLPKLFYVLLVVDVVTTAIMLILFSCAHSL